MSYKSAWSNPSIELDPQNDGATVRKAFIFEGFLNLGTLPLITHPRTILPYLLAHPNQVNSTSVFFARLFGIIVVAALTPGLWSGARNTRNGIESRSVMYKALGGAELVLIPMLMNEVIKGGGYDAVLGYKTALMGVLSVTPPLLWRIWVLYVKPELLGRYREVKRE
jgi:hypothetical protein